MPLTDAAYRRLSYGLVLLAALIIVAGFGAYAVVSLKVLHANEAVVGVIALLLLAAFSLGAMVGLRLARGRRARE